MSLSLSATVDSLDFGNLDTLSGLQISQSPLTLGRAGTFAPDSMWQQ